MKKLLITFALMLSVGLASCGNSTKSSTSTVDTTDTVDTMAVDTVDSIN